MGLVITLLIIWLILAVLGVVIKGLLWLAIAAAVLFVMTGIAGWVRGRTR